MGKGHPTEKHGTPRGRPPTPAAMELQLQALWGRGGRYLREELNVGYWKSRNHQIQRSTRSCCGGSWKSRVPVRQVVSWQVLRQNQRFILKIRARVELTNLSSAKNDNCWDACSKVNESSIDQNHIFTVT